MHTQCIIVWYATRYLIRMYEFSPQVWQWYYNRYNAHFELLTIRYDCFSKSSFDRSWLWTILFSDISFPHHMKDLWYTYVYKYTYITSIYTYIYIYYECRNFSNEARFFLTLVLILWWKRKDFCSRHSKREILRICILVLL